MMGVPAGKQELLDETASEILDLIEKQSDEVLYHEPWYGKWTMGRMIQFNTSSPFRNAAKRLRARCKAIRQH